MFLTLTPNPCLERTVFWPSFARGVAQRLDSDAVFLSAGGKGINSARVAALFGARVVATGPIGRGQLASFSELCGVEGLQGWQSDFVGVAAPTRLCLNMVHGGGEKTEIIESGQPFSAPEGALLLEKWSQWLPKARLASIGGSYAANAATDEDAAEHAAQLCERAASAGVPLIFDGRGAPLRRVLAGKTPPWAIKPNAEEAGLTLGRDLETVGDEIWAVRQFLRRGVAVVLLSCGARGVYLGCGDGIEWFGAPRVETVSAVGSGDALVGAFAAHWLQSGDIFEATRRGVAAGSAGAAQLRPAWVRPEDAAPLLAEIRAESLQSFETEPL